MGLAHLPPSTVRLLASSQVITSVSSVVKELMENSFDAGASNIEIRLEKHGLEKIEVKDDGSGIVAEDCLCMALPHYTSKIKEFSDLEKVQSYGFRGEALYSLCTIASVMVVTKTAEDEVARSYVFDNTGKVVESKVSHGMKGTTVTVTGLFKNLPVRKQVMSSGKRVGEELKKVELIVKSLAVIHPRVRVSLIHNKFLIWQKTSVAHLKLSVMQFIPHNITRQLYHIMHSIEQVKIELLIPKTDCDIQVLCFGTMNDAFHLFINKRPIKDKKIEKVFSDIYLSYFGNYLPTNKFPVSIVSLKIPPDLLDVNLEPNKTRIFIKDQDSILEFLKEQLNLYYCDNFREKVESDDSTHSRKRKANPSLASNSVKSPLKALKSNVNDKTPQIISSSSTAEQKTYENDIKDIQYVLKNNENQINYFGDSSNKFSELESFSQSSAELVRVNIPPQPEINLSGDNNSSLSSKSTDSIFGRTCESLTVSLDPKIINDNLSSSDKIESSGSLPMSFESDSSVKSCDEKNYFINEDLSLSQWSKGHVKLNGKNIEGSIVLGNLAASETENKPNDCSNINYSDNITAPLTISPSTTTTTINIVTTAAAATPAIVTSASIINVNKSLSENAMDFVNDIDKFLNSDEGNKLLQKITSTEIFNENNQNKNNNNKTKFITSEPPHILKENICQPQNTAFKEAVEKCPEKSKHCDVLERSVSSQMGKKELSGFSKFAREMRSEILKESPGMSFTLVASILATKWRNLQEEEKLKYEKISKDTKAKNKAPIPNNNESPKKTKIKEKYSVCVNNVSINLVRQKYFEQFNKHNNRNEVSIVGQIESSDLWTYKKAIDEDKTEIGVFSCLHLQEAYKFQQNMEIIIVPVKVLEKSLSITESYLGTDLWNILMRLDCSISEDSNQKFIDDKRIIMNGFRISLIEGENSEVIALLTDVAVNINFYGLEDLKQTLKLIEKHGINCSIAQSRCLNAVKYIRSETLRQFSQSETALVDKSDVSQILKLWSSDPFHCEKCPHGKNVIFPLYSIQY